MIFVQVKNNKLLKWWLLKLCHMKSFFALSVIFES